MDDFIDLKKCHICNGIGKKIIITKIGATIIPIIHSCPNCGGTGKINVKK